MQRRRSILDTFPETIDLNQGTVSSNTSMDQSSPWDNLLDPVDSRFSNSTVAVGSRNAAFSPSISGWDQGESSSTANSNNFVVGSDLNIGRGWSSSSSNYAVANQPGPRLEERGFEHSNDFIHERRSSHYGGNHVIGRPSMLTSSSSHSPRNANLSGAYQTEIIPAFGDSSDNFGTSSNSDYFMGNNAASDSSLSVDIGVTDRSTRSFGVRENTGNRNFGVSENTGNQQSVAFGLQPGGSSMGHSHLSSDHVQPRSFSISSNWESIHHLSPPVDSTNPANQSIPWNGSQDARGGNSSSPNVHPVENSVELRGESSFRSSFRHNREHRRFYSYTEARNMAQDSAMRNLATTGSSQDIPSSSSQRAYPTRRVVNRDPPTHSHQRLGESSSWTLFTPADYESGSQRGQISQMPSADMPSEEPVMPSLSSRGNHQPYIQSTEMAEEAPADDHSGWRALAADIEGRHRMVNEIRQVLNAMQRIESLRAEDYAMFDPFINGVVESRDRHRDMRLDVDSMSYEELLALEERIGNVSTGLSEETILGSMKQHKYQCLFGGGLSSNMEPCCICREEYAAGDDIGTLQCGHQFHTDCIRQWLTLKNLCPICKATALET